MAVQAQQQAIGAIHLIWQFANRLSHQSGIPLFAILRSFGRDIIETIDRARLTSEKLIMANDIPHAGINKRS
ncbi:hypothetical protein D3C71_1980260 [compost metagenome]